MPIKRHLLFFCCWLCTTITRWVPSPWGSSSTDTEFPLGTRSKTPALPGHCGQCQMQQGAPSQLISIQPKATVNVTALYSSCFPALIHLIWQSDADEISLTGGCTRTAAPESWCWGRSLSSWGNAGLRASGYSTRRGEFYRCVHYAGTWLLNWGFMAASADTKRNKIPSLISHKYKSLGTAFPCHLQTRFILDLKS